METQVVAPHIAVIGGSGFIGSSVAQYLSRRFQVTVVDRTPPRGFSSRFRLCDVRDRNLLIDTLKDVDLVVNTAIIQVPEINEKKRLGYEVNVLGVQNVCEAVDSIDSIRGLLHTSSWHVFGERELRGVLDEEFGYRPDKIEPRAKLYAMCKIAQEAVVRITSEMSNKSYGVIRLGTVLGEKMPKQTAANIFIENALKGEPMTPFKHTQYRPMLYVDIKDVCRAFEAFASMILSKQLGSEYTNLETVNLVSPTPITIVDLARIVRRNLIRLTQGRMKPTIKLIDKGIEPIYTPNDKRMFKVRIGRALKLLDLKRLTTPEQSINRILKTRLRPGEQTDYESRR